MDSSNVLDDALGQLPLRLKRLGRTARLGDHVVESGEVTAEPTTVIDWSDAEPVVVRRGAGDPSRFEA